MTRRLASSASAKLMQRRTVGSSATSSAVDGLCRQKPSVMVPNRCTFLIQAVPVAPARGEDGAHAAALVSAIATSTSLVDHHQKPCAPLASIGGSKRRISFIGQPKTEWSMRSESPRKEVP